MIITNWNDKSYIKYINYLKSISEKEYKTFSSKLITSKYEMLGIRIPILRKIAKEVSKSNYIEFLKYVKNDYYEEIMIEGFVISNIKDEKLFDKYFYDYINKIDNWSLCDSFCNSLKIVDNKEKYFNIFKDLTESNKEYYVRVGLIGILSHFVNDKYIKKIYNILDNINLDTYYVNMACAWLLCECVIKQRDKTIEYMKHSKLNDFSFNKGIQKCIESFRISTDDKKYLKSIKRKRD